MAKPVIVDAGRTRIVRCNGWLSGLAAPGLLGAAQVAVLQRAGIKRRIRFLGETGRDFLRISFSCSRTFTRRRSWVSVPVVGEGPRLRTSQRDSDMAPL
jgi:hypothetical protein